MRSAARALGTASDEEVAVEVERRARSGTRCSRWPSASCVAEHRPLPSSPESRWPLIGPRSRCPQAHPQVWRTTSGPGAPCARAGGLVGRGSGEVRRTRPWRRARSGERSTDAFGATRGARTSSAAAAFGASTSGRRPQPRGGVHRGGALQARARRPRRSRLRPGSAATPDLGPRARRRREEAMREAHVPAEQPEAQEEARVPASGCGPRAAGRCSRHRAPARAAPGSRPDRARPRPCDVRGPRAGPPLRRRAGRRPLRSCRSDGPRTAGGLSPSGAGRATPSTAQPAPPPAPRRGRRAPRHELRPGAPTSSAAGAEAADGAVRAAVPRPCRRAASGPVPGGVTREPPAAPRPAALMLPDPGLAAHEHAACRRCRFDPSCSQYALEALGVHGAGRGTWLAVRRVGRCHPWGGGRPRPRPAGAE